MSPIAPLAKTVANGRHVSLEEATDAVSADVGDGTQRTAPWEVPDGTRGQRLDVRVLAAGVLTGAASALTALATDHTTTGLLVAAGTVLAAAGGSLLKA